MKDRIVLRIASQNSFSATTSFDLNVKKKSPDNQSECFYGTFCSYLEHKSYCISTVQSNREKKMDNEIKHFQSIFAQTFQIDCVSSKKQSKRNELESKKKKKNLTHQLDWVTSKERNEHYTSNRRGFESKKLYQTNFLQNFSHFRGFDYLHSPPSISFCNLDNFRRLYSNTTIRSIALSLSLNRSLVVLTRFLLHLISMHFIIEFFFYLASRFVCIYLEES